MNHALTIPQNAVAYLEDNESYANLLHGGRGSLKTTAFLTKLVLRAGRPGAVEGLYRKRLTDLRSLTLPMLLVGVPGVVPPILPPDSYEHNQATKRIDIKGGGSIIYNGMDQGEVSRQAGSTGKTSGANLTGAHLDEVVEFSEPDWETIDMSVRIKHPTLMNQVNATCNPGPPGHFIAKRFGLSLGQRPYAKHRHWHMDPRDNPYATQKHIDSLNALTGIARARYLEGKWVGSDGMVYDQWDRSVHVVPHGSWQPAKTVWLGVDEGYSDPFVALRVEVDANGWTTITDEVYQPGLQRAEKIDRTRLLAAEASGLVVDSAAPELVEALVLAGLRAEGATKGPDSVTAGISLVQQQLANARQGVPGLRVSENCTQTIREFETYEWQPGVGGLKDKPYDRDNHAMDAIRYVVRKLHTPPSFGYYDAGTGRWVG